MAPVLEEYFSHERELEATYGTEKTIVLMEVGDFYEVYGLKDTNTGNIFGSNIIK